LLALVLVAVCSAAPADTGAWPVPAAGDVKVYERPSDDGTAIIVEWPVPAETVAGLIYVLEIAQSDQAFKDTDGDIRTIEIIPSPNRLKTVPEIAEYLGYSKDANSTYVSVITPSDHFKLKELAFREQLAELHQRDELTDKEWTRARVALALKASMAPDHVESDDLTDTMRQTLKDLQQDEGRRKRELAWLKRLEVYTGKRFARLNRPAIAEINGRTYHVRFGLKTDGQPSYVLAENGDAAIFDVQATADLYKRTKTNNLVFCLLFCGAVVAFLYIARRNPDLFIRKIAGLDAVEEAIGRSTEMGKSVYFVHGLGGMEGMATIAAVTVLGRVAARAASYDTHLRVMNCNPIVTAISQEVVQQSYTEAGRPDAYDPDDVSMVAYSQFSYAAAVSARMVREKPAAVFLMGTFMAESLLLAETGASTGAIQVAGTDVESQLPFFVTACDYTLIGEELYAASAYLSREPRMLGSLRGQDVGKAFLMLTMILGTIFLTIGVALGWDVRWFMSLFKAF